MIEPKAKSPRPDHSVPGAQPQTFRESVMRTIQAEGPEPVGSRGLGTAPLQPQNGLQLRLHAAPRSRRQL